MPIRGGAKASHAANETSEGQAAEVGIANIVGGLAPQATPLEGQVPVLICGVRNSENRHMTDGSRVAACASI